MKRYLSNPLAIIAFIAPALILFTVFVFVPLIEVFVFSFTEWDGVNRAVFTGLDNYKKLFESSTFTVANMNGLKFGVVITVYQMVLATIFAIAVSDQRIRFRKFFRTAYFIPVVLSVTVVCQLWCSIFDADNGLINTLSNWLGLNWSQNWLSKRYEAIYAIAFVNAWQWMGYQFALIVAGIKSIGEEYYEAAEIDGATSLKAHWYITLPLLKETYNFCLLVSITGGIKAFTEMQIMTGGGPGTATYTLTYIMYRQAFVSHKYGYGLSAAAILVLECLVAILVLNWIFKDREKSLLPRKGGVLV
ncbi:MAG: sugar ABC transporter permease [Christensenellales bacterium]|nr:sugar ABC transporter permease [Christensenellales bacterium]